MRLRAFLLCAGSALLAGCLAKSLSSGGAQVITVSRAPHGCERLGDVEGRSGGWIRGDVTSRQDLELGARNTLRNDAAKLGADTVQIVHREGVTTQTFAGTGDVNQVRYSGVAWRCGRR